MATQDQSANEAASHAEAAAVIADQAMKYLVNKPSLLNAPGVKLDDVYYSSLNSTVSAVEVTYNMGRLVQSLSSLSFGGSSQQIIPSSSLVGGMFLHLAMNLNNQANVTVPRGWGYAAIKSINYQLGSSNANQQEISGQSMLQIIDAEAGSEEKMSEIYRLGGQEFLTPQGTIYADVFLPFPWSSACGKQQKLPFDSLTLGSPMFITVNFNPASAFIGGSGTQPTAFTDARLVVRQGEFFNKNMSLGPLIKRMPSLIYTYPFIHHQSFLSGPITGATVGVPVSINLNSILNADLLGISFGVLLVSDSNPTGGSTPNPFNYQNVTDINVSYNGQAQYNTLGAEDKLLSCIMIDGAAHFHNSVVAAGGASPYSSLPADTYIRHVDFTRKRDACFGTEYANTWRIGNNVLTLTFTPAVTGTCQVFGTYFYNASVEVQNGETRLLY